MLILLSINLRSISSKMTGFCSMLILWRSAYNKWTNWLNCTCANVHRKQFKIACLYLDAHSEIWENKNSHSKSKTNKQTHSRMISKIITALFRKKDEKWHNSRHTYINHLQWFRSPIYIIHFFAHSHYFRFRILIAFETIFYLNWTITRTTEKWTTEHE